MIRECEMVANERRKMREEFEQLSTQFVDFLYKYGTPHSIITIEQTGAQFYSGECATRFELRD